MAITHPINTHLIDVDAPVPHVEEQVDHRLGVPGGALGMPLQVCDLDGVDEISVLKPGLTVVTVLTCQPVPKS